MLRNPFKDISSTSTFTDGGTEAPGGRATHSLAEATQAPGPSVAPRSQPTSVRRDGTRMTWSLLLEAGPGPFCVEEYALCGRRRQQEHLAVGRPSRMLALAQMWGSPARHAEEEPGAGAWTLCVLRRWVPAPPPCARASAIHLSPCICQLPSVNGHCQARTQRCRALALLQRLRSQQDEFEVTSWFSDWNHAEHQHLLKCSV